jgi:dTDP-4-amino-4,6-dideoxygalactose transaminase
MKIGRVVPPAAAPLGWRDLGHGLSGLFFPEQALRRLEGELRASLGVDHVFLVSSGTAALTLTLMALRARSRRVEVVIPAYTCFTVPAAVVRAGLQPVLCDINPRTLDYDFGELERVLTDRTLCVVAHHLFGIPADIARTRAVCSPRKIRVIEDAAQAMGGTSKGRPLGTLGDVGIFSLGRGKNITCGGGGIIVTTDHRVAASISHLTRGLRLPTRGATLKRWTTVAVMTSFIHPRLYWMAAAIPGLGLGRTIFPTRIPLERMSGLQAGLLRHWRARLRQGNRARAHNATDLGRRIGHRPQLSIPYLRLPMVLRTPEERERLVAISRRRGLGMSTVYPTPVNAIPELRSTFAGQTYPAAQYLAERLVTLPTHHWVCERDRQAIAACVQAIATAPLANVPQPVPTERRSVA